MRFMILFWGLLLVLINLGLGWFDVLMDIAGYVITIYSLMQLSSINKHFLRARNVTFISAGLLLITLIVPFEAATAISPSSFGILAVIMTIATTVLQLLLIYSITYGVADYAGQYGQLSIMQRAKKLWFYYWVLTVVILVNLLFVLVIPKVAFILAYILSIASIVVTILILKLVFDVRTLDRSSSRKITLR